LLGLIIKGPGVGISSLVRAKGEVHTVGKERRAAIGLLVVVVVVG
jgi:hypothetical protein